MSAPIDSFLQKLMQAFHVQLSRREAVGFAPGDMPRLIENFGHLLRAGGIQPGLVSDPMCSGQQHVLAAGERLTAQRHQRAAQFAESACDGLTLFRKRMGKGARAVWVTVRYPCLLEVVDVASGAVLARSEPSRPGALAADFRAPVEAVSDPQYLHGAFRQAAARRLVEAATFASFHLKRPMYRGRMGKGLGAVVVQLDWPGVLAVFDAESGARLSSSELGCALSLRTASACDPARAAASERVAA